MSSVVSRAANVVKVSFLADAATMPLHWIYNQKDVADKVGEGSPAFFSPPSCPFYQYPAGVFSPYGDESVPLAQSIASVGEFNTEKASEASFAFFTDYPEIGTKGYAGRLNHAPKAFTAARAEGKPWSECGQDDFQANGLAKVPLIVARYAGDGNLLNKVNDMVRILQNHPLSADCSRLYAKVLESVLLKNVSPQDAIDNLLGESSVENLTDYERTALSFVNSDSKVAEWVQFTESLDSTPLLEGESPFSKMGAKGALLTTYISGGRNLEETLATAVPTLEKEKGGDIVRRIPSEGAVPVTARGLTVNRVLAAVGISCALPGALLGSLYIARKASSLEQAVEWNILAGGDNASRALAIAALFAGFSAGGAVPGRWESAIDAKLWAEINTLGDKIAADNKNLL